MPNIFFTADNHFFHTNILKFCPCTRHGENVDEMNELMVEAWNKDVRPGDTIYVIGDFGFGKNPRRFIDVLDRLNGEKHLILGNHDKFIASRRDIMSRFATAQNQLFTKIADHDFYMHHFPHRAWEQSHRGSIHLFGHVHGSLVDEPHGRSMDVGIDARPLGDMRPWHLDEILSLMKDIPYEQHHGD